MSGTVLSKYRASTLAWDAVRLRLLERKYLIEEESGGSVQGRLYIVRTIPETDKPMMIDVSLSEKPEGNKKIDIVVYWLTNVGGKDPKWMIRLALEIEQWLLSTGACCVSGAVSKIEGVGENAKNQ